MLLAPCSTCQRVRCAAYPALSFELSLDDADRGRGFDGVDVDVAKELADRARGAGGHLR